MVHIKCIVEKDFNLEYETTHHMEQHLCLKKIHDVCKENKYSSKEKNGPLIDLRELKRSNAKINEKQIEGKFHIINGNGNLLGWVILKSNIVVVDKYDLAWNERVL